jgi:alanine dehydrogenase
MMKKLSIGVLREGKTPPDKRVPLTPEQAAQLLKDFPTVDLKIQASPIRCFSDQQYADLGLTVVEDLSDCDVLIGVKEVPIKDLIANKTYFFFSHTIKEQAYNRKLLQSMIAKNIQMVDYETLTKPNGKRLIGFGRYAGVVGCYNGFLAYGARSGHYRLKPAHECFDRQEMEGEMQKIDLPAVKIIVTGNGRVGRGALEIIEALQLRKVSKEDFLNKNFDEPVYVHLDTMDYNVRKDGATASKADFYAHPEEYQSDFMRFAAVADIFIAGHFYAAGSPYLFTRADARSADFKIKTVADISCDIDGPVASTIRPSTIASPLYGYNPQTEQETAFDADEAITVMAVDNLPCELPKDASADFGEEFMQHILPALVGEDEEAVIDRATICKEGDLNAPYEYLRDYVEEA